ncbi:MAG: glycosyltransferase [Oscillospiraceae bacterium]|nr:glycosyltransferase [Oscillospiraceae bacterium]
MTQPVVSVIVPVYNVKDYLPRCVASILGQTYSDLEIILVDDGSTDGSGRLCDHYAEQDSRIQVIHKENGGLSDARNAGLDIATGEYITLIDSDDYVAPYYTEVLLSLALSNKAQIAVGTWQEIYTEETQALQVEEQKVQVVSNLQALETMLYQKVFDTSAWVKLYKRSLFEKVRYPKGMLFEDLFTTYKLLWQCDTVAYTSQKLYGYYQRSNSIMNVAFTPRRMHQVEAAEQILSFVKENCPSLVPAAQARYVSSLCQTYLLIPADKYKDEQTELWTKLKNNRKSVLFDKNARIKNRVAVAASYLGQNALRAIWGLKAKGEN